MAGGYGKISPKDGKQFDEGNKIAEKWTEEKAMALGNALVMWLRDDPKNIFYDEYLVIEQGLYPAVTSYLAKKYSSFFNLMELAKKIQEIKLIKWGTAKQLSSAMTKFILINNHGYKSTGADIDIHTNHQGVQIYIPHNPADSMKAFEEANILTEEDIKLIDKKKEIEQ